MRVLKKKQKTKRSVRVGRKPRNEWMNEMKSKSIIEEKMPKIKEENYERERKYTKKKKQKEIANQ